MQRHPFPGPGLAIRILGPVTREQVKILQKADAIYIEEIRNAGLYDQISQAFAVLLPVKAVGVMGDKRTYEQVSGFHSRCINDLSALQSIGYRTTSSSVRRFHDCRLVIEFGYFTLCLYLHYNRFVFPPEVLRKISSRITNEVEGVNRVTYDISSKPPAVSVLMEFMHT